MIRVVQCSWLLAAGAAIGTLFLTGGTASASAGELGALVGGATPWTYMFGCSVCVGGGIALAFHGSAAVFLYLARPTTFAVLGACLGVCDAAFAI
jgi:hypothetical protein